MQKNTKYLLIGAIIVIIILFAVGRITTRSAKATTWADTNIPCLSNGHQNLAMHIHQIVTITVDGKSEVIPANVGIDTTCMAEVHTHDTSGEIHLESSSQKTYTLGDFFTVWGENIDRPGYTLAVTVDGKPVDDPASLILHDEQRISLVYTSSTSSLQSGTTTAE